MKGWVFVKSRLAASLLVFLLTAPALAVCAFASADPWKPLQDAALRLVTFCDDPKRGFEDRDITFLVDFVTGAKRDRVFVLPETAGSPGAYQEFDMQIPFSRFLEYSFNARIPSVVTRPSSLRYSAWRDPGGKVQKLPDLWAARPESEKPLILHGLQSDSNTPDLTTGVYYEYDLKRTLILTRHRGRPVLLSISKQIGMSRVGKKGFILGDDSDWNYYYSGETGSAKSGLGWVQSHIYDYFSVTVYTDSGTAPAGLRTGVFQWIRAGWSGLNFVRPSHIIRGMDRFARNNRMILESPGLPEPNQFIAATQRLQRMPERDLLDKYRVLQQARRTLALQFGKISASKAQTPLSLDNTPKEQMVEELMLEYLKGTLGKPTPIGHLWTGQLSSL